MTHDPARQRHELAYQFMGEVLKRTIDAPTEEAHRHALQTFLDELSPWLSPSDLPTLLRQPFTLFDACHFEPQHDSDDETVWLARSPAGEALLRAWLRRRGVDPFLCSS
jgi:hypothetical protein